MDHRICALAGALLLVASATAHAGAGSWTSNGPWGGVGYDIHVQPGAGATTAYAVTRGGLFKTFDAGFTWSRSDVGMPGGLSPFGVFAIDDQVPTRVLGTDSRGLLYRSIDGAANWAPTGFDPGSDRYPYGLADVPGDSLGLYLATTPLTPTPGPGVLLMKSTDGGNSFVELGGGLPTGLGWRLVAVDPDDPLHVLAGLTDSNTGTTGVPSPPSLYRSTDSGATWSGVLTIPGYTDYVVGVQDISFGAGNTIYALLDGGVFRSDDNGATWSGPWYDAGVGFYRSVHADPTVSLGVLLGGDAGLLRSDDGGVTAATSLNSGLNSNLTYVSANDGTTLLPSQVVGIAAEAGWPGTPGSALWAATSGGGVFQSIDSGASWQARSNGIAATNVRALAVHPNPSTATPGNPGQYIYAGFGDAFQGSPGLFISTDFGATWNPRNTQLRASQIRAIAIDPTTAGLMSGDIASSHIYAVGGPAVVDGYFNGGLYKSTNGGTTWTTLDGNLPTRPLGVQTAPWLGTVRHVVLDPRSCTIPLAAAPCSSGPLQRVYATTSGHPVSGSPSTHRIVRSDDAGATWTALDATLPPSTSASSGGDFVFQSVTPLPLLLSDSDPDVLYVGTFQSIRAGGAGVPDNRESGVFRSDDAGATWVQRSGGLPRVGSYTNVVVDVLAMAIHPADDDILWATTYDLSGGAAIPPLHKTIDGGITWLPSATGIPAGIDLRALIVDPGDADILYASGYFPSGDDGSGSFANPPGVFRSDDGGATWLSISSGLQARSVLAMTLDPFQPQVLHLGTNTGVWSMEQVPDADGDGVPDAIENNAPSGGDGDDDGNQDALQSGVGSTVVSLNKAGGAKGSAGGFVTAKVQATQGSCAQSVDVEAVLAARYGRDYLAGGVRYRTYPRDMVRFEVLDCASAEVDLIFHNADFLGEEGWTLRMFGPSVPGDDATVGWHDLSSRAEIVAPNRWRITLDADEMGSYRSGSDSILFMGGPACSDPRIFEDRFETGWVPAPGCN